MNKKEYKKKVAELFSFKSPKTEKYKRISEDETPPKKRQTEGERSGDNDHDTMPTTPKTATDIALYGKKRDVIIIGAGLSGKYN